MASVTTRLLDPSASPKTMTPSAPPELITALANSLQERVATSKALLLSAVSRAAVLSSS
jgi:hypothetical protein